MTDQPYPPFSGDDVTCPKCGGMVGKSYQPAGTFCPPGSSIPRLGNGPEWLRRRCEDCCYAWPEMCADADPDPRPLYDQPGKPGKYSRGGRADPTDLSPRDRAMVQRLIGRRDLS